LQRQTGGAPEADGAGVLSAWLMGCEPLLSGIDSTSTSPSRTRLDT